MKYYNFFDLIPKNSLDFIENTLDLLLELIRLAAHLVHLFLLLLVECILNMFLKDQEVIDNFVLLIVNKLADILDILVDLFLNALNLVLELGVAGVWLRRLHQFKGSL